MTIGRCIRWKVSSLVVRSNDVSCRLRLSNVVFLHIYFLDGQVSPVSFFMCLGTSSERM